MQRCARSGARGTGPIRATSKKHCAPPRADTQLSAPARAYAGTLSALGRARRGDLKAARDSIRALGYVDQWLVVGPFDNEGKAGLDTPSGPEPELLQAIVPGKAYTGKERPVRYRPVPAVFPYGYLDAGSLVRPESKVCVFATSFVSAPKDKRKLSVWAGAGGAFKLFWNGDLVLQDSAYRGHDYDRSATQVELEPGPNELTIKLCGDDTSPVGSVRVAAADGAPDPTLVFSNDFLQSQAFAKAFAKKKPSDKLRAHAGPEGPVQLFQKLTLSGGGRQAKPAALEAFARYLADTGGDDPARHEARDFAKQAADAEPTVRRLLLAGRLAEDRNQTGEWITKAEALAAHEAQPNATCCWRARSTDAPARTGATRSRTSTKCWPWIRTTRSPSGAASSCTTWPGCRAPRSKRWNAPSPATPTR